jgi:hypothetical protein
MHRLISALLGLTLLLGGGSVAPARQSEPDAIEIAPGITATQSVTADVDAFPRDSSVALFSRYALAPGAEIPANAGLSVALLYVEAGQITTTGTDAATILRAGAPEPEISEPGIETALQVGDALYAPVCSAIGFRNTGSEPATLLIGGVTGLTAEVCPGASPVADASGDAGLTADFVALGEVKPLPALPAQLAMVKLTFAPGAAEPQPGTYTGTVLARVDGGAFALTMTSGEGIVIRKPATPTDFFSAQQEPLVAGVEATLNPGDMLWAASGTFLQTRNPGTDPATMVVFVLTAAAGAATPAA